MAKQGESLDNVLAAINKKYGSGSIMTLGDTEHIKVDCLSTGSLMIDKILGGSGIPVGRIIEVYGMESSGKSSMSLQLVAQCQKAGGKVAYIDVEQAMDPAYAKQLGVDIDSLIFSQPASGEQALAIVEDLAKTGQVRLIIVDSVAALTPQVVLDGEMGDMTIGALARLLSRGLSKLIGVANENKCTILFINQIRQKINTGFSMGDPNTTTGGNALKFYASQRIELKKTTAIKEGEEVVGYNTKITVKKNKIAPPLKSCTIPFMFGKGFGGNEEVISLAVEYGLIEKSGAWATTHDGQRINGMAKVREYYEEHPDLFEELKNIVKSKLSGVELEAEYTVDPNTGEIIE